MRARKIGAAGLHRRTTRSIAGPRSLASLRVITIASARASPSSGSRSRPTETPRPRRRIERVHQHDIEIARQPHVLEAIVQQHHVGAELPAPAVSRSDTGPPRCPPAPRRDRRKICGSSPVLSVRTWRPAAAPGGHRRRPPVTARQNRPASGRVRATIPPGAARTASSRFRPW